MQLLTVQCSMFLLHTGYTKDTGLGLKGEDLLGTPAFIFSLKDIHCTNVQHHERIKAQMTCPQDFYSYCNGPSSIDTESQLLHGCERRWSPICFKDLCFYPSGFKMKVVEQDGDWSIFWSNRLMSHLKIYSYIYFHLLLHSFGLQLK